MQYPAAGYDTVGALTIFCVACELAMPVNKNSAYSDDEIEHRMNAGIRRALSTPPSPTKSLVGKTERAKIQQESRDLKARQAKPKSGEAS